MGRARARANIQPDDDDGAKFGGIVHHGAIRRDDKGLFAEARNVLQNAPEVGGFHHGLIVFNAIRLMQPGSDHFR